MSVLISLLHFVCSLSASLKALLEKEDEKREESKQENETLKEKRKKREGESEAWRKKEEEASSELLVETREREKLERERRGLRMARYASNGNSDSQESSLVFGRKNQKAQLKTRNHTGTYV